MFTDRHQWIPGSLLCSFDESSRKQLLPRANGDESRRDWQPVRGCSNPETTHVLPHLHAASWVRGINAPVVWRADVSATQRCQEDLFGMETRSVELLIWKAQSYRA